MDFILDHLVIGNHQEAEEPPQAITALLCVAREREVSGSGLRCLSHKVPIADMQPIPPEQLREAVEWIVDQIGTHTILVFCNAGVGRAPSVVIAYLCCVLGYGFGQAVEYVARRRPYMSILPNLIRGIDALRAPKKD